MLLLEDLQRPRLSISSLVRHQSWADSSKFPRLEHRWNRYLNQLTLSALTPWIDEQQGQSRPRALPSLFQSVSKPVAADEQHWQWVTGAAMKVAGQRWIVIPTDDLEVDAFGVPQEWVDIPSWAGDYYLMVQLDPEAGWLQIRGYLNHRQLKQQADYREAERTYAIADDALIQDTDLLWVMAELESESERRGALETIPALPLSRAEDLIQSIRQALDRVVPPSAQVPLSLNAFSPRLALPFEQWAGIMENPQFCRLLEQAVQTALNPSGKVTSLRRWLAGEFERDNLETSWQSWEQFPSLRWRLGLRHQMPVQSVSRGKRFVLDGLEPALTLWATVTAADDGRMQVLVQLRHQAEDADGLVVRTLPKDIKLILLTPAEKSLQVVVARDQDDYIQLKRFKVPAGQLFSVEVRWGDQVVRERFQA